MGTSVTLTYSTQTGVLIEGAGLSYPHSIPIRVLTMVDSRCPSDRSYGFLMAPGECASEYYSVTVGLTSSVSAKEHDGSES
jgi:hypothetical protein